MQIRTWQNAGMPTDEIDDPPADGLPVGAVAARLGVSAATLRSWGTRYGLMPAIRSPGGHRRYSESDIALLVHMLSLVSHGAAPADAARTVQATTTSAATATGGDGDDQPQLVSGRRRPGGPGGRVLAVPNGSAATRGLARAASRLDAAAISHIVDALLETTGACATWDDVLRPVLVAAGDAWARTGAAIDIEHILSESIIESLRLYRARQPSSLLRPPVLLAGSAGEQHVLPLHVVSAALAELRVPTLLLGARVPGEVLAAAARRTRACAVFLWRQQTSDARAESAELTPMRPAIQVVVGGPGWDAVDLPAFVHRAPDLNRAVQFLQSASEH